MNNLKDALEFYDKVIASEDIEECKAVGIDHIKYVMEE